MSSGSPNEITDKDSQKAINTGILLALYEKRLELFNIRRGHEWQVLISVVTLLIAADAGLLSAKMLLGNNEYLIWAASVGVLAIACISFEYMIQTRNRVDRIVLFKIQKALCEQTSLTEKDYLRLPPDYHRTESEKDNSFETCRPSNLAYWNHFLWAFMWQAIVVLFVALLSIFLVPRMAERLHNEQSKEVSQPSIGQGDRSSAKQ